MMLDAVMSDMGCTHPPMFELPDISGLAPLVLPESLLRGQDGGHAMPSPDAVRRFDTAMNAESPSFTRHVAAVMHMVAGDIVTHVSPNETEARQVVESTECPETPVPEMPVAVSAGPCRDTETQGISIPSGKMQEPPVDSVVTEPVAAPAAPVAAPAAPVVAEGSVERPVESPVASPVGTPVESPVGIPVEIPVEHPDVVSTDAEPVAVPAAPVVAEGPVERPIESPVVPPVENPVESPVVPPVEIPVEHHDVVIADAEPVAAPATPVVAEGSAERPVEDPVVPPVETPVESPVGIPVAIPVESPVGIPVEIPVEHPDVVSTDVEPVAVPAAPVVAEGSVDRPVESPVVPPVDRPVESSVVSPVETPVESPVGVPVGIPVEIPVEHPDVVSTDAEPVVVPAAPVVAESSGERLVESPVVPPVESPIVVPVERPDVVSVDVEPVAGSVERSEAPSIEAPVAVVAGPRKDTAPQAMAVPSGVSEETQTGSVVERPEEKAVAASAHVVVGTGVVEASVPPAVQPAPEAAAVSAASARTVSIVETVNQIVEAVVGQILVTPAVSGGECEVKIMLKPTVLDGSEIAMSSKDGTLTVSITPATQEASVAAASALPRLETALAEHAPAFHHVSVVLALKKGNRNEAV